MSGNAYDGEFNSNGIQISALDDSSLSNGVYPDQPTHSLRSEPIYSSENESLSLRPGGPVYNNNMEFIPKRPTCLDCGTVLPIPTNPATLDLVRFPVACINCGMLTPRYVEVEKVGSQEIYTSYPYPYHRARMDYLASMRQFFEEEHNKYAPVLQNPQLFIPEQSTPDMDVVKVQPKRKVTDSHTDLPESKRMVADWDFTEVPVYRSTVLDTHYPTDY